MGNNSAQYEITLKDNFSRTLDKMESRLNRFERRMKDVNKSTSGFGRGAGFGGGGGGGGFSRGGGFGMAGSMFGGFLAFQVFQKVIEGIVAVTKAVVVLGGELEQTRISFGAMLGGGKTGDQAIGALRSFAVATPFSQKEVLDSSKQMLAYGFGMAGMTDNMRMLGDVAAGLNLRLDDMVFVYGTLKAQGRAFARDLYQFAHRGIPIYDALQKTLGKTRGEIKQMTSDGLIGFKEVENAFKYMTREGSMFGGLMEKQSHSLFGRWERFTDKIKVWWADIGEQDVNPVLGKLLDQFSDMFGQIGNPMDISKESSKVFAREFKERNELLEEYIKLNEKKNKSDVEQDRLIAVFEKLVEVMPEAVAAWDKNYMAMDLNVERARELLGLTRQIQEEKEKDAIWANRNEIGRLREEGETIDKDIKAAENLNGFETWANAWMQDWYPDIYEFIRDPLVSELEARKVKVGNLIEELNMSYLTLSLNKKDFEKQLNESANFDKNYTEVAWSRWRAFHKEMDTGEGDGSGSGSGLERIQAQTRNVTITIGSLVEGGVHFESFEKNEMDLVNLVSKALVLAVNDVNSTV